MVFRRGGSRLYRLTFCDHIFRIGLLHWWRLSAGADYCVANHFIGGVFTSFKVKKLSEEASQKELQRRAFLSFLIATLQGIKRQAVESRIYQQFKIKNQQRYTSKTAEEQKNAFAQECIQ